MANNHITWQTMVIHVIVMCVKKTYPRWTRYIFAHGNRYNIMLPSIKYNYTIMQSTRLTYLLPFIPFNTGIFPFSVSS